MSMTTYFQIATAAEIAALEASPETINEFEQPHDRSAILALAQTVAYFVCGTPYPSFAEHGPLAAGLAGEHQVATDSLENGSFDVVRPMECDEVAAAFAAVDLADLRRRVDAADLQSLVGEQELYDLEPFLGEDDIADMISEELEALVDFYRRAALEGSGVVIFSA